MNNSILDDVNAEWHIRLFNDPRITFIVSRCRLIPLFITLLQDEPYIMIKQNGLFLTGNDRFEGYVADILQRLSTSIGFEYEIRLSSDGRYGEASLQDGQWNGILGEVLRNVSYRLFVAC